MSDVLNRVITNLRSVQQRIAAACTAADRSSESVQLVAVTKYASPAITRALIEAGALDLGESRPQSLWSKAESLAELAPRWHMIGHLQRNKVRRTLPLLHMIHSLDSDRIIREVEEECRQQDCTIKGLIEVNISGDAAKHGFDPADLPTLLQHWPADARIQLVGLMGMAGLETTSGEARRQFAQLRQLRDSLQSQAPPNVHLAELSMGMSNDFEAAIAEGATLVRVGSTLMEGVDM